MDVETLQVASELAQAVELFRDRKPKTILEIGVWKGGTLREWLRWSEAATEIVAVDLEHPNLDLYSEWKLDGAKLTVVLGNSQWEPAIEEVRRHAPYEWIFIDGDHGLPGVTADVENYLPMLASGGVMLLHDIAPPDGVESYPPGVVLNEYEQRGFRVERYIDDQPSDVSHGIGAIFA